MTAADAPLLIAYDGSDATRTTVREAAKLFGSTAGAGGDGVGARAGVRGLDADC